MATSNFNSMPQNITYGIRDMSVPDPILVPKQYPTHLPLWFLFAKKGPTGRILADGAIREQLYGSETFDPTSKYFTHQTQYSNIVNAEGNQAIYHRLIPPGAAKSAIRIWVDVLPEAIPDYIRLPDGNYQLDSLGNPISSGNTVNGVTIKFVKTAITEAQMAQGAVMTGDQQDGAGNWSQRYPFMDILASHEGVYGDDLGIRIWAPTANARIEPDTELIEDNRAYPYQIECLDKSGAIVRYFQTLFGSSGVTCVFKDDQIKRSVVQSVSFDDRFIDSYTDLERPGMAPLYGPFGRAFLYKNNLDTLLTQFYSLEQPYATYPGTDFEDIGLDEIHRFNFISGKSSKGVPYYSYRINRIDANSEPMSDVSAIWLSGGNDGTIDSATLNGMVKQEIEKYGDINQEVTEDRLGNPESFFYDSGFNIDTKLALANFIAVRKDTFLVWCLQDADAPTLDGSQESSLAIALYTRGHMLPESSEYGTPAARFMIVACDGKLIGSQDKQRRPLSLEIASKSARYMGAGNGLWRSAFNFSHGRFAEISMFRDVNVTWRPIAARRRDWYNGMVYVQKKDMDTLFFPALRTGYSVDNSILTSYFTALVFVDLQKVADRLWSEYSGSSEYSNEQFQKYLVRDFNVMIEGKYDKKVRIVPNVIFTAVDEYNGYSWTLSVDVGADVMKTVQYTLLTGYRRESMPGNN